MVLRHNPYEPALAYRPALVKQKNPCKKIKPILVENSWFVLESSALDSKPIFLLQLSFATKLLHIPIIASSPTNFFDSLITIRNRVRIELQRTMHY
ncbi:conserved hypothetical protein [Ricinus communis]|uniref:Uncharacterized protein n=1 Tax=Ricinus communis TaxID=3988 RepID=B9SCC2_RICCO|nr:conserved hypothetical protein [Ricinus communis]